MREEGKKVAATPVQMFQSFLPAGIVGNVELCMLYRQYSYIMCLIIELSNNAIHYDSTPATQRGPNYTWQCIFLVDVVF